MTDHVFIIGAARSGSTALAEMLHASFGLDVAQGKETHFLASAGIPDRSGGPDGSRFDRLRARTLSDFERRFAASASTAGRLDASTSSLYYAGSTRAALDRHFPDARLIAVLRDPVTRAVSAYRYMKARGLERESWHEALTLESTRVAAGWPHIWHYISGGLYAEQIRALGPWADRTLFLLYESDMRDPSLLAERIAAHLGRPILRTPTMDNRNSSQEFFHPAIGHAVEHMRSLPGVRNSTGRMRQLGRRVVDALRRPASSSDDFLDIGDLGAQLKGQIERVATMTGLPVHEHWRRG